MLSRTMMRGMSMPGAMKMMVARPATASASLRYMNRTPATMNMNITRLTGVRNYSDHAEEETFEEFTTRFEKEFDEAYDLFEVQRVLNNCFSYDLVPAPAVLEKALRAARRVNDLPTAVRVFEALKYKVENEDQYKAYLEELKDVREELGVPLKEELFPDGKTPSLF